MRTMKKVLALSLVLAMAFSMVAGAAFKDEATINSDLLPDINLMIALNVFAENGTGEGNFEPNLQLRRDQAAKLVYVLKNKGVDNGATGWTGMNLFSDVTAGNWAEGYINYCASTGAIAGDGTGNFNPAGTLTGQEFAKLLLIVIGYKSDIQGYVGNNWSANVLRDAEDRGFFVDYDLSARGPVTREWAARLMNNAISAQKVKYVKGELEDMYVGNSTTIASYKNQDLGLVELTGVANGTAKATVGTTVSLNKDGKTSVVTGVGSITYNVPAELIGHKVKVAFKDANGDGVYTAGEKVYGVVRDTNSKEYNVKASGITVDTVAETIKFAGFNEGKAKDIPAQAVDFIDNFERETSDGTAADAAAYFDAFAIETSDNVKFIDNNNDGKIDVVVSDTVVYGKVTAYTPSTNRLTITNAVDSNLTSNISVSSSDDFKKYNVAEGIAKDDIVAVKPNYTTGTEKYDVTKVQKVTGTVSKVAGAKFTVSGTEYKMLETTKSTAITSVSNTESVFYVVGSHVVFTDAVSSTSGPTNVAMIIDGKDGSKGTFGSTAKVQVITQDGTVASYPMVAKDDLPTGWMSAKVGGTSGADLIWNILDNKDGTATDVSIANLSVLEYRLIDGKIAFKPLAAKAGDTTQDKAQLTYNKEKKQLTAGSSVVTVNGDSFFFVKQKGDKYSVIKATEMPLDATLSNLTPGVTQFATTSKSGSLPVANWGVLNFGSNSVVASSSEYAVVVGDPYEAFNAKGDKVVYVTTRDNTDPFNKDMYKTVETALTTVADATVMKNQIVEVEYSGNVATLTVVDSDNADDIFTMNNALLAFGDGQIQTTEGYILLKSDVKIWNIDTTKTGADLFVNSNELYKSVDGTKNNVAYNTKSIDGKIYVTDIFVEINGLDLFSATGLNNGIVINP